MVGRNLLSADRFSPLDRLHGPVAYSPRRGRGALRLPRSALPAGYRSRVSQERTPPRRVTPRRGRDYALAARSIGEERTASTPRKNAGREYSFPRRSEKVSTNSYRVKRRCSDLRTLFSGRCLRGRREAASCGCSFRHPPLARTEDRSRSRSKNRGDAETSHAALGLMRLPPARRRLLLAPKHSPPFSARVYRSACLDLTAPDRPILFLRRSGRIKKVGTYSYRVRCKLTVGWDVVGAEISGLNT